MTNRSLCKQILLCLAASVFVFSGCQEGQRTSGPVPGDASDRIGENIESARAVRLYVNAMMLSDLEKWQEAIEKVNQAIEFAPDFSLAYTFRGDIYQLTKDYENSADSYEAATKLDPWSFQNFASLGKVSEIIEDYRRAVKAYVNACELDPEHYGVHLGAAKCFHKLEDHEQAFGYGQRSKELNPEAAEPDILLGKMYDSREDYISAVDCYRRALEIKGNDPDIMVPLAVSYIKLKRFEAAEELLEKAIEIDPSNNMAYQYLGFVQLQIHGDKLEMALASYDKALEIDSQDWMAHKGRGVVFMLKFIKSKDTADKNEAIKEWKTSLDIKPDQPELITLLRRYSG